MTKVKGKQVNPAFVDNVSAPNAYIDGEIRANVKMFEIQHPDIEDRVLVHSCLEGPENAVYLRGRSENVRVDFPNYWRNLVHEDSITVHITPIGTTDSYAIAHFDSTGFTVINKKALVEHEASFFWIAYATRKDVPALVVVQEKRPIPEEEEED